MKHSTGRLTAQPASSNEIDHILSREDEIQPSSGFLASVMDAVQREAAVPPPIPFPWKRAIPGLAAACFALVLVLVVGFMASAPSGHTALSGLSGPAVASMPPIFSGGIESAAIWTAMSLLLAWVSVKLSMRLAVGRV
jgi:hypothetical protein